MKEVRFHIKKKKIPYSYIFHLYKLFEIFDMFAQNLNCEYTLEPPRRECSYKHPQSMFWIKKIKTNRYSFFFYIKLGLRGYTFHRNVFLMNSPVC